MLGAHHTAFAGLIHHPSCAREQSQHMLCGCHEVDVTQPLYFVGNKSAPIMAYYVALLLQANKQPSRQSRNIYGQSLSV